MRRLPNGLIGWRYLCPGNDRLVRLHCRIWRQGFRRRSRGLRLAFEIYLWFRWVCFLAGPACRRTLLRLGPEAVRKEEIPLRKQAAVLQKLARGWCIPPDDVYRFGLLHEPRRALEYVYDHEAGVFHAWRNRRSGSQGGSEALLADKQALAEKLGCRGIPIVQTQALVSRCRNAQSLASHLGDLQRAFCKTRSGNRGLGAFSVWRTSQGLAGRTFQGKLLPDTAAVESAWLLLCRMDDALIQPLLENHPFFADLACNREAVTVRYISRWRGDQPACLCATLEVPAEKAPRTGHTFFHILPIEAETGCLQPFPERLYLTEERRAKAEEIWRKVEALGPLPGWLALAEASHRAQREIPDLWAIAWDWVLTPQGPLLLEGNSGWGTSTAQVLLGGFLKDEMI